MKEKKFNIIAHRGDSGAAPENTLAAIQKALDLEVDMIEIDVRQTADNVLVLMHDKTINRTTNGKGNIKNIRYQDLRLLDAGSWFDKKFSDQKVPTLEEAIKLVDGRCKLLIEIKGNHRIYPGLEIHLSQLLTRLNCKDWCIVQSFFSKVLENIHQVDEEIRLYKLIVSHLTLINGYIDNQLRIGNLYNKFQSYPAINPNYKWVTRKMIRKLHERNQSAFIWTVNDEPTMKKLIELDVDGIITNYPEKLKKVLQVFEKNTKFTGQRDYPTKK